MNAPSFQPPERFNIAEHFLGERLREGRGERAAILTETGSLAYREVNALANRFGNLMREMGVVPEQRVLIALPDGPHFVGALFGALRMGAVAVMVNRDLKPEALRYLFEYTRGSLALVDGERMAAFREAGRSSAWPIRLEAAGDADGAFARRLESASAELETFPSHRDDAAIWLFSGGTTGHPKAVVQTHASFGNTAECYGKGVLAYREDDVTLSVPKLFFGYATGSNLFFPFAAGATTALFPERCTADVLFRMIERFRPTVLVNVPTMVNHMVNHPEAASRDLSSLRLATSAGEALPAELYQRWKDLFGVELLDGLGTAEMWHVFISNRPGDVKPGTLGRVVPGFEVRVRDDAGVDLPDGETGWLWVRGNSRAIGYWQQMEKTKEAFRGEWYVSGDMVRRDADGAFTYCGRGDDMLKVSGKWLAPGEVENCLLRHPAVKEAAVVGVVNRDGLTKPHAFIVRSASGDAAPAPEAAPRLVEELQQFVREQLAPHAYPRQVHFVDAMPRTHLGKVDRARLKASIRA